MKISKKAFLLLAIYTVSIFLILGGFIYKEHETAEDYKRNVAVTYNHAFAELTACIDEIGNSLHKSLYATSPSMVSFVCADIYAKSLSGQMALSALPFSNIELEHTAAFISKQAIMYHISQKKQHPVRLTAMRNTII